MDYALDIVVSEKDLSQAGIREIKFYWDGTEHSHTPKRFIAESLSFIGLDGDDIYKDRLSNGIDNPVMLISKDICDLWNTAHFSYEKTSTHALVKFICRVCQLEKFRIYICDVDEKPECFIRYTESCNIPEIIYNTFRSEKSIVIYK
ncbi:MAG: hypothetical protein K2J40_04300 [Ruminococcus sp.]|nr:hypothetical protein [Ruminococcus sp.]